MSQKIKQEKKEEKEEVPDFGGLSRVMKEFGKGSNGYFTFGLIASVLNGFVWPAFSILFKDITDVLFTSTDVKGDAVHIMIRFIILGFSTLIFTLGSFYGLGNYGVHISVNVRKAYFELLLKQEVGYYDEKNSGELNSEMVSNSLFISNALGSKLGFLIQNIAQFFAGFVIAFYFSWEMALVLMACLPVLAFVGIIQGRIITMSGGGKSDPFVKSGSFSNEVLLNIRTVVSNPRLLKSKTTEFSNVTSAAFPIARKRSLGIGFGLGGMMFGMFGVMYSIGLWYGSRLVDDNKLSIGEMFGCFFGFLIGGTSLGQMGSVMEDIKKCQASANQVFALMERKINIKNYLDYDIKKVPKNNQNIKGHITFENVKFSYPSSPDREVIKNISFTVKPGQTLALVGPSGSGKSTIVSLLERFYDPVEGEILIDGKSIDSYNLSVYRQNVGYVSQLPLLFGESIKENIRHGLPKSEVTDEDIINACKFADAHDFIMTFPKKYDTDVGEMGSRLSGGQKQRIAIARAIVSNPSILLFDEATSALDTKSEREVQKAINKITNAKDKTIITIAHRLSTIKNSDCIVVIVNGAIQEVGTHEKLMENVSGVYYALVNAQRVVEIQRQKSSGYEENSNLS